MRRTIAVVALALLVAGCGSKTKYVPVSGKVTLDGKPLANVHVQFQPMSKGAGHDPGPGSYGVTDATGMYTLRISSQQFKGDGAVVGKHKVSIGTILEGEGSKITDTEVGSPDGVPLVGKERLHPAYNQDSILTMEVPEGGRTDANFELYSKGPK